MIKLQHANVGLITNLTWVLLQVRDDEVVVALTTDMVARDDLPSLQVHVTIAVRVDCSLTRVAVGT